ncbi:MAG: hypothetical protein ACR2PG_08940 [Hyphomicrobiaceae bacterium]
MTHDGPSPEQQDLLKIEGALDLLFDLRETFAQWVEEAQDDSKQEALENVLGHVEAIEREFKHRREENRQKSKS